MKITTKVYFVGGPHDGSWIDIALPFQRVLLMPFVVKEGVRSQAYALKVVQGGDCFERFYYHEYLSDEYVSSFTYNRLLVERLIFDVKGV